MKKEFPLVHLNADQCLRLTHRYQIPTNDIIYLESEINYTNVYTSDNRKHISSFTLKILEARIVKNDFLRINRGCLVNLKHITQIIGLKRNAQARLSNGSILTISRRKFDNIRNILNDMIVSYEG
ncbi:LytR/AlgR family response regulator transcription factor [Emticicia sp.]|uniref:LytR/AlgR family response regulator transcription factor n=1 Tax=Emticicia sp. TaxID=1930953 RepID=UPI0037511E2F